MKFRNSFFLYLFLLSLFLTSCQAANSTPVVKEVEQGPAATYTPASGTAVLTGIAVDRSGKAISNTPVRLAEIYRQGDQGAFVIDAAQSPSAITDEQGLFTFVNVPPAEYLVVIGYLEESNYAIYQNEQAEPFTFTLEPDKKIDIGTVRMDFAR